MSIELASGEATIYIDKNDVSVVFNGAHVHTLLPFS